MQPKVIDVEQIKKQVRKLAAGKVLAGGGADVSLDLGAMDGCRAWVRPAEQGTRGGPP